MKGVSGSANVLAKISELLKGANLTMEPGDFVGAGSPTHVSAAPIAYDLWYLHSHDNFLSHYSQASDGYDDYLSEAMGFLAKLVGLKPIKALKSLAQLVKVQVSTGHPVIQYRDAWANDGVYWINTLAFELWSSRGSIRYSSSQNANGYRGYISMPMGQLGVMEVISLFRETELSGYQFNGSMLKSDASPGAEETPVAPRPAEMFPPTSNAANNGCFGTHLVESAYLKKDEDFEWLASKLTAYAEDTDPKLWMRLWIKPGAKWPVPGEFVGILCKALATPPHVWWFQESNPFVYAGNWMDTWNLTSGVVTEVIAEEARTDSRKGNQYKVKIQGCEIYVESSDYFEYSVGDRVAILKTDSTSQCIDQSYTWNHIEAMTAADKGTTKYNYIIIPAVFYQSI
jgi:hypothetical protein